MGVMIQHCLCGNLDLTPHPVQWVKDLALPHLWHRLQVQLRLDSWFDPWKLSYATGVAKINKKISKVLRTVLKSKLKTSKEGTEPLMCPYKE